MRPKIFVTQPVAASALERLRAIADVRVNPVSKRVIAHKALVAAARKHDIIFSLLHDKVDRAVFAANPKLRLLASQSITPDNIDVAAATARKIPVTVVPPIVAEATADINFGLMLMVLMIFRPNGLLTFERRRPRESSDLGAEPEPAAARQAETAPARSPGAGVLGGIEARRPD